jgi:hypothetical protein
MNEQDPRSAGEIEPSAADLVESAVRKLVTAVVIAGGLIALAVYWQPASPHYQAVAADGRIYRINTRDGTIIGCQGDRCAIVLQHGHRLEDNLEPPAVPKQLAPPPAPAPAPAPAPSSAPAPAPH